jgi:hypothetical protein
MRAGGERIPRIVRASNDSIDDSRIVWDCCLCQPCRVSLNSPQFQFKKKYHSSIIIAGPRMFSSCYIDFVKLHTSPISHECRENETKTLLRNAVTRLRQRPMLTCGSCGSRYCGKECQSSHWKRSQIIASARRGFAKHPAHAQPDTHRQRA